VPVLFSSHQLAIVERLCDDVVIISKGRVVANGSREELRAKHAGERYEIVVQEDAGWVRDVPGARILELDGPRAVFEAEPQQVLRAALDRGEVRSFTPVVPTLDEIFREVI
jgi:ABC-2 type transport system ATP-binding protein